MAGLEDDLALGDPALADPERPEHRHLVAQRDDDVDPHRVDGLADVGGRRVRVGVRVGVPHADDVVAAGLGVARRPEVVATVDGVGARRRVGVDRRDTPRSRTPVASPADDRAREQPARFVGQPEVAVGHDALVLLDREPHERLGEARRRAITRPAARVTSDWASWMARHTRPRTSGMSMWRTPRCDSASMTAFCTAGVEPIVPDSPMPFAPSGFSGVGVSVFDASKLGNSAALGIA